MLSSPDAAVPAAAAGSVLLLSSSDSGPAAAETFSHSDSAAVPAACSESAADLGSSPTGASNSCDLALSAASEELMSVLSCSSLSDQSAPSSSTQKVN